MSGCAAAAPRSRCRATASRRTAGTSCQFIGNVKYRDSTISMDADFGTYYKNGERWEARGQRRHQEPQDRLDAHRAVARLLACRQGRPRHARDVRGRPPQDQLRPDRSASGKPRSRTLIVGDRVRFKGNDRIWAGGKVTIDRSDFAARSDSMRLDTGQGQRRRAHRRRADLRGLGPDSFRLSGRRIDLALASAS